VKISLLAFHRKIEILQVDNTKQSILIFFFE